jgi:hypothetical protein
MPRNKEGYKTYKPGDPIHIVVTQDFVDTANDFFSYCKDKGYNPSQIIRQAMGEWLRNQVAEEEIEGKDEPLDVKLVRLMEQSKSKSGRISLRTAKEILEDED